MKIRLADASCGANRADCDVFIGGDMKTIATTLSLALFAGMTFAKSARADCTSANPCLSHVNSGTGAGLRGENSSGTGVGVTGFSINGTAIAGYTDVSGSGTGVYGGTNHGKGVWGASSSNGYGGYFVAVTGIGVFGTATESGGTAGWFKSTHSGAGALVAENTTGGTAVWVTGNGYYTGSWSQWSDARLKKDIRDINYGLGHVLQLRPVTYKLKEGDDRTRLGFIAQEVEKVIPDLVLTDGSKGMLAVDYVALLPVVINAVQEQQRIIQQQAARIASLENGGSSTKLSSIVGGGALFSLLPLGLVLASRRRRDRASSPEQN
jgi:hypothetical protein